MGIEQSNITVIVDKGEQYNVNIKPGDDYLIQVLTGNVYPVHITQPTTVVVTADAYFRVADFAYTAATASFATTASYALNVPALPDGLISQSSQVQYAEISGIPDGIVSSSTQASEWTVASSSVATSASYAATASYALNTVDLPDGLISESSQVILQDTTGNLSASRIEGTVASALTASYALNAVTELPAGLISSSTQVNYTELQNIPAGIVSSSTQATTWTVASASVATTASYAQNANLLDGKDSTAFATTGSNTFIGNQIISGSLITTADTMVFVGTMELTGSFVVSGSITGALHGTASNAILALTASYIDGGYY
jgi:hypothetical protein